ncbi:janus kinase and microtubule-interacting protein 3-like [Ictalurus furcatus]|uniref:janus kinase and microtubule-interacting protein 3-like n=1 Tax=Ictalurus furcatus TaxID=66913 RepID=UPI00234FB7D8|nr:janus kinase and microtubule-interacting protein 3-like [Ictalurus furcatus]
MLPMERERRSPAYNLHISATENSSSLQLHCQREGIKVHTPTFSCIHMQDVIIPELMKKLDILGDNGNLRNEEQVTVIQASTVLSRCEKQDPNGRLGESLSERQRAELAESMEAVRRQILRQSRHADTLILQQRMELLQSAQQRIRELEDKIDMQRRQIKEIEEKFLFLFLFFSLAFILWP